MNPQLNGVNLQHNRLEHAGRTTFVVFRGLFVLGLLCWALQFFGLFGNSDAVELQKAFQTSNDGLLLYLLIINGSSLTLLLLAVADPKRSVFVIGASLSVSLLLLSGILINAGASTFHQEFGFVENISSVPGWVVILSRLFPLFGFLAVPPSRAQSPLYQWKYGSVVQVILPALAGFLLAIVPTQYFTGSFTWNASQLHGFYVGIFVIGGIVAAITGVFRKSDITLFCGVAMSLILLQLWVAIAYGSRTINMSYWPGAGMILGIIGCLLLLFSAPITNAIARVFLARKATPAVADIGGVAIEHPPQTSSSSVSQILRRVSERKRVLIGSVLGLLCLLIFVLIILPSVPGDLKHVVFDNSSFAAPITLTLPTADSPNSEAEFRRSQQNWPYPLLWGSNAYLIPPNILRFLEKNGFAVVHRLTMSWGANNVHTYSFLSYTNRINPYLVQGTPQYMLGGGRFRVAFGYRVLQSIDYHKEYQTNALGMNVKVYALTFSYTIRRGGFPGVIAPTGTYHGEARAYQDPNDGQWKLDALSLGDRGSDEFSFAY